MQKLNKRLIKIFNAMLVGILILIPLGLLYRLIQTHQFLQNCHDHSCGTWIGIVFIILLPSELYLWIILKWLKRVQNAQIDETMKSIQLLLIFILGVLPGIFLLYPAFIKQ
jgi:H+/Cl- antiporter ClcA